MKKILILSQSVINRLSIQMTMKQFNLDSRLTIALSIQEVITCIQESSCSNEGEEEDEGDDIQKPVDAFNPQESIEPTRSTEQGNLEDGARSSKELDATGRGIKT